jgi:TonB family protein
MGLLSAQPGVGDEAALSLSVLNYQSFDAQSLATYMLSMKEQIKARIGNQFDHSRSTKIFFQIFSDGRLLQNSVQESSGDATVDAQAKSTIQSLAPFPAPPRGTVRLMNIVATFGPNSVSRSEELPSLKGLTQDAASIGESGKEPLQGEASQVGENENIVASQKPTRLLQGEVGAQGTMQGTMQGTAQASALIQGRVQSAAPPMFQPQIALQAPLQGAAQNSQSSFYQSSISHGQITIGVLGCEFGLLNNQIRQIMPGSDLLRYGVMPGDIIEAADGQSLRGKAMQSYIRGTPGTFVQLTIFHQGRTVTIPVQRKDARLFSNYNGYFKKWAAHEKFW